MRKENRMSCITLKIEFNNKIFCPYAQLHLLFFVFDNFVYEVPLL